MTEDEVSNLNFVGVTKSKAAYEPYPGYLPRVRSQLIITKRCSLSCTTKLYFLGSYGIETKLKYGFVF